MRDPHFKRDITGFLRKAGVMLILVGIAACVLPLLGLQLRKMQKIELGPWTGVPFIVLGVVTYALSFLAQHKPRALKYGAFGALGLFLAVGVVSITMAVGANRAGGLPGPPAFDDNGAFETPRQRLGETGDDLEHARSLAARPETRPSAARPFSEGNDTRPAATTPLPNESAGDGPGWTITLSHQVGARERIRLSRAVREAVDRPGTTIAVREVDGALSLVIGTPVDASVLIEVLRPWGELRLQDDYTGTLAFELESPGSALRGEREWRIALSNDNLGADNRRDIRFEFIRVLSGPDKKVKWETNGATPVLIVGPIDDPQLLRRLLSPYGTVTLNEPDRTATLKPLRRR